MQLSLTNRRAIVTGAARGIGAGIARCLSDADADLALWDIEAGSVDHFATSIRESGGRGIAAMVDVTDYDAVAAAAERTVSDLGPADILVNCAGGSARDRGSLFCNSNPEVWKSVIDLNLIGALNCTRAVINRMIDRQYGKVINIGSTAGMVGATGVADYAAAKGGVIAFTMALAKEVAQHGINVNCVSPGPIMTDAMSAWERQSDESLRDKVRQFVELTGFGAMGTPEDIGHAVTFLASDLAGYITGQNHCVGGLRNLGGPR